jgi:iron-sulfur cluster repair protein YtfE (RIC family)
MSAANHSTAVNTQHVTLRTALPANIQQHLLPMARQDWSKHPAFGGSAAFFIAYHGNLLNTINSLVSQLETLIQLNQSKGYSPTQLQPVLRSGLYLVEKAHHHHQIEDASYFPQFRKMLPQFSTAMDLLDDDHLVLDEALHRLKHTIQQAYGQALLSSYYVADLYQQAKVLKKVLARHLQDEEEIIIPIFLKYQ